MIWGLIRAVPLKAWAILAALAFVVWLRSHWIGVGEDRVQAQFDAYKQRMVALTDASRYLAELSEQKQAFAFARIAEAHAKELDDAKRKGEQVAADLRAGNLRLRNHWRGCPSVPGAAGSSKAADGASGLRETGAGNLVRVGATCDARIRALQDALKAERSP